MVPEAVGGAGSRAARLAGHAKEVARKARGLEAALVDKRTTVIAALDDADTRSFSVAAAGPAALIVSKMHKIRERLAERAQRRLADKDALDVLRLLQAPCKYLWLRGPATSGTCSCGAARREPVVRSCRCPIAVTASSSVRLDWEDTSFVVGRTQRGGGK